jgi:hypothetical protein
MLVLISVFIRSILLDEIDIKILTSNTIIVLKYVDQEASAALESLSPLF